MSPLPMLRLNTRIGGSDSTPTTAFAGPRRCRFRTDRVTRSHRWDVAAPSPKRSGIEKRAHRCALSMTGMCTPCHAIAMTMTDSSNGPKVQEPAREAGDGRLVATAADLMAASSG